MVSHATKTGVRLIQDLNMDNVFDKVDKTKDTEEQFHEFALRAENLANTIKENISSLFSTIEAF